ncbi:MAG: hydrogenase/urease maturation nickel metallochaperone HypA [Candidatus Latescibacterota bacterium]
MHELSTSQSIAQVVLNKAREQKATKVVCVDIEIGEFSFLNPEQVAFWVKASFEGTPASG